MNIVQTAADLTLVYVAFRSTVKSGGEKQLASDFDKVFKASGTSTDIVLVGTKYDNTWNDEGTAPRKVIEKHTELLDRIAVVRFDRMASNGTPLTIHTQVHRSRIRSVFCVSQSAADTHPNWDLDRLDDLKHYITDFLRRKTDGGTLAEMVQNSRPDDIAPDAEGGDEGSAEHRRVYTFIPRTELDYLSRLSCDWVQQGSLEMRMNSVTALIKQMQSSHCLTDATRKELKESGYFDADLDLKIAHHGVSEWPAMQQFFKKYHDRRISEAGLCLGFWRVIPELTSDRFYSWWKVD